MIGAGVAIDRVCERARLHRADAEHADALLFRRRDHGARFGGLGVTAQTAGAIEQVRHGLHDRWARCALECLDDGARQA